MSNGYLLHACTNVFVLATQVRSAALSQSVAEVRQRFRAALDDMVAAGGRAGVAEADLAEAKYALVAFIDEQVLHSTWSGRTEWMSRPLQLELYREGTAGENFFVRLRSHLQTGHRKAAIEVYYLCLLMGFSGAYGSAGDAESLGKFMHAARKRLAGHLPPTQPISPRATRRGQLLGTNYGWAPVAALAAAAAVMAALVLGGFGWATQSRLEKLIASMDAERSSVTGAH